MVLSLSIPQAWVCTLSLNFRIHIWYGYAFCSKDAPWQTMTTGDVIKLFTGHVIILQMRSIITIQFQQKRRLFRKVLSLYDIYNRSADLVSLTEEILNRKCNFLCSGNREMVNLTHNFWPVSSQWLSKSASYTCVKGSFCRQLFFIKMFRREFIVL